MNFCVTCKRSCNCSSELNFNNNFSNFTNTNCEFDSDTNEIMDFELLKNKPNAQKDLDLCFKNFFNESIIVEDFNVNNSIFPNFYEENTDNQDNNPYNPNENNGDFENLFK